MQTDAEILQAARKIVAAADAPKKREGLPVGYHGPVDLSYVRGTDVKEFPKMAYKASTVDPKGYITRIVTSQEGQDALPKGWLTKAEDIHKLLDPLVQQQYVSPDEAEGHEPEEKEVSLKGKQAAKDAVK